MVVGSISTRTNGLLFINVLIFSLCYQSKSVGFSPATQHVTHRKYDEKLEMDTPFPSLNTRLPPPTLLYAGYSVKPKKNEFKHNIYYTNITYSISF